MGKKFEEKIPTARKLPPNMRNVTNKVLKSLTGFPENKRFSTITLLYKV